VDNASKAECLLFWIQADAENRQLRAKIKQMAMIQGQNKVCIDQLLSRLQDAETARRSEQSTMEALRQQVNTYREDFEGERLDRHRAQERVVNLERQVAALKQRVHVIIVRSSFVLRFSSVHISGPWQEL